MLDKAPVVVVLAVIPAKIRRKNAQSLTQTLAQQTMPKARIGSTQVGIATTSLVAATVRRIS
jgi:hypothetical protein